MPSAMAQPAKGARYCRPGSAPASATNTVVCPSAPCASSRATVSAASARRRPISTSTQRTPWLRCARIASSAIALLPVPSSPVSSSRCPRPIGSSVSITVLPVYSGRLTASRSTIAGERASSGCCRPTAGAGPPYPTRISLPMASATSSVWPSCGSGVPRTSTTGPRTAMTWCELRAKRAASTRLGSGNSPDRGRPSSRRAADGSGRRSSAAALGATRGAPRHRSRSIVRSGGLERRDEPTEDRAAVLTAGVPARP